MSEEQGCRWESFVEAGLWGMTGLIVEGFVGENPNLCQHNVHFSIDFIFSNWLLMYLSDDEIKTFITKSLSWLRPGGFLFFRESCNYPSGND